jgi:hypothetical protein
MATVVTGTPKEAKKPVVLRPRVLVPFLIAVLVLGGALLYGELRPHSHVQLKGPGTTNKLHWGGGVFTSRAELRAWLNAHGKSYAAFAKAHPAAVRMLPAETAKP